MFLSLVLVPVGVTAAVLFATPFFRRCRADSPRAACINNLRVIQHAKLQIATACPTNLPDSYVPSWAEIRRYFKNGGMPICRNGGQYAVNALTGNPTCSKSGKPDLHVMPPDSMQP